MVLTGFTKRYVTRIMAGEMTYDEVPSLWKKKVKDAFDEMLVEGIITEDQYNKYLGIE